MVEDLLVEYDGFDLEKDLEYLATSVVEDLLVDMWKDLTLRRIWGAFLSNCRG